jgi:hypothetical protein
VPPAGDSLFYEGLDVEAAGLENLPKGIVEIVALSDDLVPVVHGIESGGALLRG